MGLFGRKRKIIDLSESYDIQKRHPVRIQKRAEEIPKDSSSQDNSNSGGFFGGFFGGGMNTSNNSSNNSSNTSYDNENKETSSISLDAEEKRRRLAKRLQTMTEKLDDVSNQIYHLQQRLEVIEKKLNINNY